MTLLDSAELLEPELRECLRARGFQSLTPIQSKVLSQEVVDRDLRVTSQTGSGKTVAIGLLMRGMLREAAAADGRFGEGPRALVVVPTRELAKQVHEELTWLYRPLGLRLACMTGGANYRDERRALASNPAVVIGTPGRLLDHVDRGALRMAQVHTVVLDEADRMLDLGFSEAIEAIFAAATARQRTHLVSATLEPQVLKLANRYQANPLHVQGTRYGEAHADIEHRVHLVESRHRRDALINLLLLSPDEKTLVFARTRADVGEISETLSSAGFRAAALSGDMEQPARDRALAAFRQGRVSILVATDVAARGIDVQDMTRVIQVDPPTDPESLTHRSGRTGRAGHKGTNIVLVEPARQRWFRTLLAQARIDAKFLPLPSSSAIRKAADERLLESLVGDVSRAEPNSRWVALAERLLTERDPNQIVAALIAGRAQNQPEPRDVPAVLPESANVRANAAQRKHRLTDPRERAFTSESRPQFESRRPPAKNAPWMKADADNRLSTQRGPSLHDREEGWGMFHVTWGQLQGADARRMLAVVCRRGQIRGTDVGAIRIGPTTTTVEIRGNVAAEFASNALKPDPQEPKIRFLPVDDAGRVSQPRHASDAPSHNKPWQSLAGKRPGPLASPKKLKKFPRASAH